MDNKKKKRNQKRAIFITVAIIAISIVSLLIGRQSSQAETILRDSVATVEYYLVKRPIQLLGDVFSEYKELKNVYKENEILKSRLDEYLEVAANNQLLETEIKELKSLLKLDYLPTEYTLAYASVHGRSIHSWDSEIIIGAGNKSGIKENMPVVSTNGMIGVVTQVTELNATVSLLSSKTPAIQIPVEIVNGEDVVFGLLERFDATDQLYQIKMLSPVEKIDKDAKVYTSGLGGNGMTPRGIYIGDATNLKIQPDGTAVYVQVKPSESFDDLRYVAIVKGVSNDE